MKLSEELRNATGPNLNNWITRGVESLEEQIEKMKCCFNCKHQTTAIDLCKLCDDFSNWELKE